MIERLRPTPTATELEELYAVHNDAERWTEHQLRTAITIELARSRFPQRYTVIDPAAGNGRAARAICTGAPAGLYTADLAPTAPVGYPGVDAITYLRRYRLKHRPADVIILGEILEHVDDPAELLAEAAGSARGLILSTPLEEEPGLNIEHVWRWDKAGVIELLVGAGWRPTGYVELDLVLEHWPPGYRCQIHTAEVAR